MPDCLTTAELAELRPGMPLPERHFAHLTGCPSCRKAVDAALRETEASDELPAGGPFDATLDAVPLEEPGRYRRARADGQPVLLGAGGFARVELARDEVIGRDVALKTLRSGQLQSPRRAIAEKRLLQEARVVGQLEHPAIVPLYDLARTDDGQLFYAMRRIRGRTLADAIRAAGSLDERLRLLPHVLAACHAVAYAHSRGVLHRDLKPQNVMIDRFGETLVIDWGLASARGDDSHDDADLETSGVIRLVPGDQTVSDGRGRLGTPAYMSPEQLTGLRALVDARSDVFGLGGILYEVLTGQAPREHGPLQAAPKRVLEVTPTVPRDLAALCDKALESSRDARYQTAEELARDLDAWLHGLRVTAHAYRPLELARRFARQHRYALLVGLAAFLALVAMSIVSAVRVRDERNQARSFALLLAGDALDKLPFDERDPFRGDLTARVSSYLATTDEANDPTQAATAWARLASEFASISRNKEALHAAQRCLTLLPEVPTDERTEATRLMCEVTVVEESGRPLPERLGALERLWAQRRAQPTEPNLLNAQVALLLSLGHLASNTGDEAASVRWSTQAFEIARHVAVLEPSAPGSWSQLGTAHYVRSIDALNAGQGEVAVSEARDAIDCARRAHQLQHSPHSLLRLADMLSDAYFAQELHPAYARPGEHEATAREAQALFEALLALDDGAPVPRRRFSEFLVQRGDLTRAWALVEPVPITDFFHQRPKLYLALLVGQTDLVLSEQAREPESSRSIDSAILPALAHAVKGDYRAAALAARQGVKESFASHWPVEAMEPWSTKQRGPAAPAVVRVAAELTAAQRDNDEPRAHRALEAFAAELDALSP